jgi:hypothetical protein
MGNRRIKLRNGGEVKLEVPAEGGPRGLGAGAGGGVRARRAAKARQGAYSRVDVSGAEPCSGGSCSPEAAVVVGRSIHVDLSVGLRR